MDWFVYLNLGGSGAASDGHGRRCPQFQLPQLCTVRYNAAQVLFSRTIGITGQEIVMLVAGRRISCSCLLGEAQRGGVSTLHSAVPREQFPSVDKIAAPAIKESLSKHY